MTDPVKAVEEQTHITELTIRPDGRIYVFGASRGILEILRELQPRDAHLIKLLQHVRQLERGA